ncbi:MAG: YidC/Oxa1 family membrane protein insertase [Actinomycetota bacterium]
MFDAIARVLAFFYSLPVVGGSVGYAIILLTAAVMTLLMPLTIRATRSTIKMQEVQPKLKELQKKHKDDKQTLNQELMALYSENGINPVGGCLPMLAQLPVFLVLFRVLSGLTRRVRETHYFAISDHARTQAGGQSIPGETFDPNYLSPNSELYVDLSRSTEMSFGPFDLALEALDVIQSDFLRGIPYVILILFVVGTSFYQQRQVSARRGGGMAGMNPQQEMILKFLPLLSGIWSFVFPAGLVLYWATSNVFRIGQQAYITRRFYGEREEAAAEAAAAGKIADDDEDDTGSDATTDDGKTTSGTGGNKKGGDGSKSGGAKSASKSGSKSGAKSGSASSGAKAGAGASSNGNGRKPRSAGNDGDDKADHSTNGDRNANWERRRQQKAKVQASARNRKEQSSRVTPKGTNPGGPKKKRKR